MREIGQSQAQFKKRMVENQIKRINYDLEIAEAMLKQSKFEKSCCQVEKSWCRSRVWVGGRKKESGKPSVPRH